MDNSFKLKRGKEKNVKDISDIIQYTKITHFNFNISFKKQKQQGVEQIDILSVSR